MRPKLKVGLLLDGMSVPYWASRSIDRIVRSDHSVIVSLLIWSEEGRSLVIKRTNDSLLYKAYRRLDHTVNGSSVREPLAPEKLPPELGGVHRVHLESDPSSGTLSDRELSRIRDLDLDVLINFSDSGAGHDLSRHCRYGELSLSPGDGGAYDGQYTGFWEIFDGAQTIGSHVKSTYHGSSALIYRSWSRTVMRSVKRNREQVYHKGISFLPRVLEAIYERGADALEPLDDGTIARDGPARPRPGNMTMTRFLLRRAPNSLSFLARRAFFEERWAVRYSLESEVPRSFGDLTVLVPPRHIWWGDPQAAKLDDDFYIFVEELALPHSRNNGHISVIKVDHDGHQAPVTVLERPYHLSYPFVFEWKGVHYMVPESSANRTIELYEATEFPYHWKLVREIMTDVEAVDTTLVRRNGLWWLFTNIRENAGGPINDELFLFFSDDLLSDYWEPHPLNPIVTNARTARPAGKIFEMDGALYRPSQDCSRCYGYAVNINRIQEMNEKRYKEVNTTRIEPDMLKGASRVHTFSHIEGLTAVDTYMARPRPFR